MARKLSGEALVANARSLLNSLEGFIDARREEEIRERLPLLRRQANMKNPPRQMAADAISLSLLKKIIRRANEVKLTQKEKQALDIFIIAFATVSRVGEIVALNVENVAQDGSALSLRPKTGAKTWLRLTKRVTNGEGVDAADRLARWREEAAKQGRTGIFANKQGVYPTTATITRRLKKVSSKVGIRTRVTAHSARKGAAVEAVLAGVPLPVIQALGGWKDLNTLQAYIGESVRRSTPLLEILGRGGRARTKEGITKRRAKEIRKRRRKVKEGEIIRAKRSRKEEIARYKE